MGGRKVGKKKEGRKEEKGRERKEGRKRRMEEGMNEERTDG